MLEDVDPSPKSPCDVSGPDDGVTGDDGTFDAHESMRDDSDRLGTRVGGRGRRRLRLLDLESFCSQRPSKDMDD